MLSSSRRQKIYVNIIFFSIHRVHPDGSYNKGHYPQSALKSNLTKSSLTPIAAVQFSHNTRFSSSFVMKYCTEYANSTGMLYAKLQLSWTSGTVATASEILRGMSMKHVSRMYPVLQRHPSASPRRRGFLITRPGAAIMFLGAMCPNSCSIGMCYPLTRGRQAWSPPYDVNHPRYLTLYVCIRGHSVVCAGFDFRWHPHFRIEVMPCYQ